MKRPERLEAPPSRDAATPSLDGRANEEGRGGRRCHTPRRHLTSTDASSLFVAHRTAIAALRSPAFLPLRLKIIDCTRCAQSETILHNRLTTYGDLGPDAAALTRLRSGS